MANTNKKLWSHPADTAKPRTKRAGRRSIAPDELLMVRVTGLRLIIS